MRMTTIALVLLLAFATDTPAEPVPQWPEITRSCRPWAYNWWLGSAVDKENLGRELSRYQAAGLGGVHIVPIYGAKGAEGRYIPYLSPRWIEMLKFAIEKGEELDLGVDMTTGTGWCFGGPSIGRDLAGQQVNVTDAGFQAAPSLRRVKRAAPGGGGYMLNPFYGRAMDVYLERFTEVFDRPGAPRPRAMYHDSYEYGGGNWSPDLLKEFAARRGYRLEDQIDAFAGKAGAERNGRVRCDWRETLSDMLLQNVFSKWVAWCKQRGMKTRNQAHGAPVNLLDFYALVDIPETEMFGRGTRDPLRSGFDERFGEGDRDPLISKFASSAAHLAGRRLTSAETSTWMAEHFCETLEEFKCFADLMFVSGVNHVIYHGCVYSPDDAAWPGWLFYASSQMNPRNPVWHDAPTLNRYIARCQAVLRAGQPGNDILLYWPIHDLWHDGTFFQFTVHSHGWLVDTPLGKTARRLWEKGYGFDYVSDRLLAKVAVTTDGELKAPGGATYQAIVVPPCRHMPETTLKHVAALVKRGARVIFEGTPPQDVPGLARLEPRRRAFRVLTDSLLPDTPEGQQPALREKRYGQGRVLAGPLQAALDSAAIMPEPFMKHQGALFIRRRLEDGAYYFIANQSMKTMDGWYALASPAKAALVMDPLSGRIGKGETRVDAQGRLSVRLLIEPGHSIILRTCSAAASGAAAWKWPRGGARVQTIEGPWKVRFIFGGPKLPKAYETPVAGSWTTSGDPATEVFAGTAVYGTVFDADDADVPLILDLGEVKNSARVRCNGRDVGVVIMHPYRLALPAGLLKAKGNTLEIEVTNLAANRIRDLDRRKVPWRIFHDINLVNIRYKEFDASQWPVFPSGLLGPVVLREAK